MYHHPDAALFWVLISFLVVIVINLFGLIFDSGVDDDYRR